jgi:formylglycine-generating enzyme required for sulfatase activity
VFDPDDLWASLGKETYEAVARLDRADPLAKLSAGDLRATLIHICRNGRWETVGELTTRMLTRPSLLREHQPGVYTYPDASLQAFVAAGHLATQPDLPSLVSRLAQEDLQRWREVILFVVNRLAWLDRAPTTTLQVIDALCRRPLPEEGTPIPDSEWRSAWLAGEALVEIKQAVPGATNAVERVSSWLLALLERGMLRPKERASAGSVLDQLSHWGSRPGVPLPEPLWCEVPSGMFWSGEGASARIVETGPYWISRYPVTQAQYATFVQATGHPSPSDWQGDRPHAGMGNHPVVHVTWQDAVQYCTWRTERLGTETFRVWRQGRQETAQRPPRSWTIRLPTSLEWEKAARGGLSIPADEGDEMVDNPLPRRIYPWGDSWRLSTGQTAGDETRCNVSASGIGTTTPVGMYPDGVSPYGVMDAAGNVWEWCLDWASEANRYKIRRGGAFRYSHDYARCAAYDKGYPGLAWPYLGFRVVLGPPASDGSE